jgi:nicotinate-nucleotide adenylyltransferase
MSFTLSQEAPLPKYDGASGRIGLLGGSFNPPHEGHLQMSLHALRTLGLTEIWWLVTPQNPLKNKDNTAPFEERLRQAQKLLAGQGPIFASDAEARLGTCYTADTLRALKKASPEARFVWLMGADNLAQIESWHEWQELFRLVPIAVFRRSGYDEGAGGKAAVSLFGAARLPVSESARLAECEAPAWVVLDNPLHPLSSTEIRNRSTL